MSQQRSTNSLPVIQIATPCPMQWDKMQGDDSKRFCNQCTKNVFNFAEMPRDDVSDLLCSGQSVCARISRHADGSIVTLDDKPSTKRLSHIGSYIQRLAVCAAGFVSLMTFGGCDEEKVRRAIPWLPEHEEEITGIVAPGAELGDIAISMPVEEEPVVGIIESPVPETALPEPAPAEKQP